MFFWIREKVDSMIDWWKDWHGIKVYGVPVGYIVVLVLIVGMFVLDMLPRWKRRDKWSL